MRYPLAPVATALHVTLGQSGAIGGRDDADVQPLHGMSVVMAHLGISHSTALRWQRNGLTDVQADRAATAVGLHPCLLWPEWWDEPTEDDGFVMAEVEAPGTPRSDSRASVASSGLVRDA